MLEDLIGDVVILDMDSHFVLVGTMAEGDHQYVVLEDADVHDLRDSSTTREIYVREIHLHGLTPNRKRVLVQREQIVSVSRLSDVSS